MAMNWFNQSLRCLCLLNFMFITACTDGIPLTLANNRGWIEVTQPTSERVYTTTADSIELSGDAFILPTDNPEKLDITWENAANNTQGTGVSNVGCIDLVTDRGCFSDWTIASGQISLELGNNLITITAADDKGNRGTVSINVQRAAAVSLNLSSGTLSGVQISPLSLTDVNGDGELDVIAVNLDHDDFLNGSSTDAEDLIVVFLAEGDEGFRQAHISDTISDPRRVAACDINADELIDLSVYNDAGESANFTGNGDGTFIPAEVVAGAGSSKQCMETAGTQDQRKLIDLNGDTVPDVVSAVPEDKKLKITLGNEPFSLITELNPAAKFVTSADINSDGVSDIVTVNSGSIIGSISVLMGQGDGTFDNEQVFKFEK